MSDDLIAEALTEHWGPRCKTKDTDDFPELAGATQGRCACCLAWEQYDGLRAEVERLTAALSDERAHADAMAGAVNAMDGFAVEIRDDRGRFYSVRAKDYERLDNLTRAHRARRQG